MSDKCCEFKTNIQRYKEAQIIGERKNYETTIFPSTIKAGEAVSMRLPPLRKDVCLFPGSVKVSFNIKVNGTKSTCVNNLTKALVKNLTVTYGGTNLYSNTNESTFALFKDLWLTSEERVQQRSSGIITESMRKKISGDDSYTTSTVVEGLFKIFGSKMRIQLGKVLMDHRLFAPSALREEFEFKLVLASNEEVLITQPAGKGQPTNNPGSYQLKDLKLEYDVVENKDLADECVDLFAGYHAMVYEDIMTYRIETWAANDTVRNIHINPSRRSLKAVVCLFKDTSASTEDFEYSNIERVGFTADGVPGAVFNSGIPKDKLFKEVQWVFGEKGVTESGFYLGWQFGLVIDLRTTCEKDVYGNGKEMSKKKESQISLENIKNPLTKTLLVMCS